ncbi:unnamed protein product [Symbiodinium sp. CCMP2456]|nr:unnamed protein product [Symbiodinium sp. CCMP2456]
MPINFDWFDLGPFASAYFVETGLFHGEGALKALSSGLFRQVISIEVNAELVERAREKLKLPLAAGLLKVVHDDSCNLWHHIKDLREPCTFFLDAHGYWVQECPASSGDPEADDRDPDSQSPCPLLAELEAIAQHPLARQHKVLIDDRRCLQPGWEHPTQSWWRGLTEEMVLEKLRKVNPDFRIQFIDGLEPQDIIAAVPPECLMEMLRAERRQLVKELALRRRAPWPHPAAAALLRRQWQGGVEGEPPLGNRLAHKMPTSPPTSPRRPGRLRERLEEEEDRLRREANNSAEPLSEAKPRDKIGEALQVPPVALAGGFPRKSSPSRARDLAGLDSRWSNLLQRVSSDRDPELSQGLQQGPAGEPPAALERAAEEDARGDLMCGGEKQGIGMFLELGPIATDVESASAQEPPSPTARSATSSSAEPSSADVESASMAETEVQSTTVDPLEDSEAIAEQIKVGEPRDSQTPPCQPTLTYHNPLFCSF